MGKPSPPPPPNLVGAAQAQGQANENSALATNFLNQVNQVGPTGSLTYAPSGKSLTLPDGTVIPQQTATTTLSPEEQQLFDQQMKIGGSLNDAAIQGIGLATNAANQPLNPGALALNGPTAMGVPDASTYNSARDNVANAMMQRLAPQMQQQSDALDSRLASQGIELGSKAYNDAKFNLGQQQNDQRSSALLAGDQEEQNLFNNRLAAGQTNFNQGLASNQFQNQAQNQALQEQAFLQTQPLNVLNALRTGNQYSIPTFGNAPGTGANIAPAPIYEANAQNYNNQMQAYNTQMQNYGSMLSGLGSIGGAAMSFIPGFGLSDRRLKSEIGLIGIRSDGLGLYAYTILGEPQVGVMADEVAALRPDALGPTIAGYASVNYGAL